MLIKDVHLHWVPYRAFEKLIFAFSLLVQPSFSQLITFLKLVFLSSNRDITEMEKWVF